MKYIQQIKVLKYDKSRTPKDLLTYFALDSQNEVLFDEEEEKA